MMRGQVALIVLIVSAVVLTFGLSISRKTVVETKIDTDEELLKKAFNAAESGINYYLGSGDTEYVNDENQERADVTVKELGGTELNFEKYTLRNQKALFWLVGHDADGSINSSYYSESEVEVCVDSGFNGSLKVDYFYKDAAGDYKVGRYGYNIGTGSTVAGFTSQALTNGCFDFSLGGGSSEPLLISVTPLFNGTQISMKGDSDFPSQGEEITSVGRAGDLSDGGVNNKVTVVKGYKMPFFMIDAVTAGSRVLSK